VDGEAFVREVYDASYRRLVGQLVGITGGVAEAEDVVQEAFARACQHVRLFRRTDNPEAWLRKVAINLARSRWRRIKRWTGLAPSLAARTTLDGLSPDHVALVAALKQLPATQREAIALHHIADLPVHEVAATLGVPAGTVKARLSRGRTALAALLSDFRSEAPHA
jgi:RNA polymerase sigma-70 factor (ECF subfamily)